MSKKRQLWIGLAISLLCVAGVLWAVDLRQVGDALTRINWLPTVSTVVTGQVIFMLLRAWRWGVMLEKSDGSGRGRIPFWRLFHAQNVGYLITNVFPFRLGDIARAYLVGLEPGMSGVQALSSVVLERVLDLLCIAGILGMALPFIPTMPAGLGAAGILFSVAAVGGLAVILVAAAYRARALRVADSILARIPRLDRQRWVERVAAFLDGFSSVSRWQRFTPVSALSLALWGDIVAVYYLGLRPAWPQVSWPAAMLTVCAAAFGISAPSSPGSVGVFHGAVVLGLSVFPIDPEMALSFALVYHATMYMTNLVLGLLGLWRSGQSLSSVLAATKA